MECQCVSFADAKEVLLRQPLIFKEQYHLTATSLPIVIDDKGKPATSHSIRVTGLESADEQMLWSVFESRLLSGGDRDTVEEVIVAPDCTSAIIIYTNAESKQFESKTR